MVYKESYAYLLDDADVRCDIRMWRVFKGKALLFRHNDQVYLFTYGDGNLFL